MQRALKELQIEGLVERRAGSGTYVLPRKESTGHLFGLLIPGLGETEIFEPMCQGMAKAGRSGGHALIWGHATHGPGEDRVSLAHELCDDFITRGVSGVFFAPLEGVPDKDKVNISIANRLSEAGIAVVLLDRGILPWPHRTSFDLVGIDNRRGGYLVTNHLLSQGAMHPTFLSRPNSAPTVNERFAGFAEAVRGKGFCAGELIRADAGDKEIIRGIIADRNPDAFVCSNDAIAAKLMQTLDALNIDVPGEIKITGFDDLRYSSLLRVPLTTVRQPCQEIGETALLAMVTRLAQPDLPARDFLLDCKLVVRASCGSQLQTAPE